MGFKVLSLVFAFSNPPAQAILLHLLTSTWHPNLDKYPHIGFKEDFLVMGYYGAFSPTVPSKAACPFWMKSGLS